MQQSFKYLCIVAGLLIRVIKKKISAKTYAGGTQKNRLNEASKEPSQWDGSFEHQNRCEKLMDKEIIIILSSKFLSRPM